MYDFCRLLAFCIDDVVKYEMLTTTLTTDIDTETISVQLFICCCE